MVAAFKGFEALSRTIQVEGWLSNALTILAFQPIMRLWFCCRGF